MILAANKTHRRDPTNNFNYYTGGWDITNSHYIFSVAYTAVPLVITAIIWFVVGGFFLLCACLCCCCCCCRKKHANYSRTFYAICLIFLVLFTISAIVGTGILYAGQWRFYKSVEGTFGYLVQQGKNIFDNFQSLWSILASAKDIKLGGMNLLPINIQDSILNINSVIQQVSKLPMLSSQHSSQLLYHAMSPPRRALNVLAALMLFLTLVGLLLSVLGMRLLVYILTLIGWILVTITFLLCAVFLLFHNVVADTCVAMHEWVENPTANSALSQLLPCMDTDSAKEILNVTKVVSFLVVEVTNSYTTNITNQNFPPEAAPLYYNQSGPLVPLLCNPIDQDFNRRECAPGEVDLSNATQVIWKNYICQVSETGICTSEG
ncbi:uncharacterized protein LOC110810884, partial [Carica papaya]|uniref:uncharacterized protein LOC110810884 n=1 Tax=Carica papaya TaxID=3649 RepID=UPI000B8C8639